MKELRSKEKIDFLNKHGIKTDYHTYQVVEYTNEYRIFKLEQGNTLGCILLGINKLDINKDGNLDITSSKAAMKKLLELMPDKFELKIIP